MPMVEEIRAACARVAERARSVRVVEAAIEPYARMLPAVSPPVPDLPDADLETRAAFSLTLNAVNFGSGWFPTLRKPEGLSGFRTVEAALRARGPWRAGALVGIGAEEVARTLGQDPRHELMALFAHALDELGRRVRDDHGGSFLALARAGGGSVHLAGIAPADDIAALTLFADNLVPHVLRLDGVLEFAPELIARIEREELIERGSPEEVEIRACALHAVELLVAAHGATTATAVDNALWHRGGEPRYKARPRHRAPCTAY